MMKKYNVCPCKVVQDLFVVIHNYVDETGLLEVITIHFNPPIKHL